MTVAGGGVGGGTGRGRGSVPRPVAVASDFAVLCALGARRAGVALAPRMALPAPASDLGNHTARGVGGDAQQSEPQ
ncbi:hypothetical protein OG609_21475 [Streptomyces sp. NBC_01224]|uniref:hypothetical protein n=1 Tax=unclassified Streptomyces TaxID=2593676 RepID=UPI002E0D48FC|nr:hypothetical protein OG609_21475 [Streptomyces sp. NBC_01224]